MTVMLKLVLGFYLGINVLAVFISWWAGKEAEKRQRSTFDRVMQASTPRAAGLHRKRVS